VKKRQKEGKGGVPSWLKKIKFRINQLVYQLMQCWLLSHAITLYYQGVLLLLIRFDTKTVVKKRFC